MLSRKRIDPSQLDPEKHLGEETRMIYEVLAAEFGKERAGEIIVAIMEGVGGLRLWITAAEPLRDQMARSKAAEMLRQGLSVREVLRETGLKPKQMQQVQKLDRARRRT